MEKNTFTDFNISGISNELMRKIQNEIKEMNHCNIIIAGKTGVGKSTLLNAVFREELAETGTGIPVTQQTRVFEKPNFPLRVYDTKGLELGKGTQQSIKEEIDSLIQEKLATNDPDQYIHVVWYCINTASDRIEEEEINWIRELAESGNHHNVPVILVLTKTISKKKGVQFKNYMQEELRIPVKSIVPVLAQPYEIDDDDAEDGVRTIKPRGLDILVGETMLYMGESARLAFVNAQKVDLGLKVNVARKWIKGFTATNFAAGFVPIPFSDAPVLIATEISMLAKITAIFGINVGKDILKAIVSSIAGVGGATLAGKTVVANLLKFIPGVGTAVGGAISGSTAALLTYALGEAYIKVMSSMVNQKLRISSGDTDFLKDTVTKLFREEMSNANETKKMYDAIEEQPVTEDEFIYQ